MTIHAIEVMSNDEARAWRERIRRLEFVDGRASAGGAARVKQNTQASGSQDATAALVDELVDMLARHPMVRSTAFPRHFGRVAFNRYGPGDYYGLHADAAWMGRFPHAHRSDLSFTLFFSEPDEYEGGELRIASGLGSPSVKLPAGQMVVYPTKNLHEVTEVRSGERYAAIGWIESWIADRDLRELASKARTIESMMEPHGVPLFVKLMMNELARDLERYGSR